MSPTSLLITAISGALLAAIQVKGHGIATGMVVFPTGVYFRGYNPSFQYSKPPPVVIQWSTPADLQNTYISPSSYAGPDIVCHLNATAAGLEAPVNAGDILEFQWNTWPASHKGPVIDYLAKCDGPCTKADKTKLSFFKISEVGLVDPASDTWGSIQLLNNNMSWLVKVPSDIAPGNYILRHEIISLHAAGNANGAQNYPFCFNLAISSNGTKNPDGVLATKLYKATDPGILYDLFAKPRASYVIPGPPLYTGAATVVQSKAAAIKATGTGIDSWVAPRVTSAATTSAAVAAPPALTTAIHPAAPDATTLVKLRRD